MARDSNNICYKYATNIFCDKHRTEMVPFLMFEYIEIRYHIEAKRLKNEVSQKLKEEQHKLRKLSKMKKTARKTVTSDYFPHCLQRYGENVMTDPGSQRP
ncbi:hypothetical protein OUZ56_005404 [Daphnia magna]|uniref:Uncharacterized protein n=1 Tax=Daphnia magna TaxID=35525 RepID=A0ABQ9YTF7_9CRUS|nr:hypothetical protein OUZ56_005404 [Daphnia magna]